MDLINNWGTIDKIVHRNRDIIPTIVDIHRIIKCKISPSMKVTYKTFVYNSHMINNIIVLLLHLHRNIIMNNLIDLNHLKPLIARKRLERKEKPPPLLRRPSE